MTNTTSRLTCTNCGGGGAWGYSADHHCDCGGSGTRCEGCELAFPNPDYADFKPDRYRHKYVTESGMRADYTSGYVCCNCDDGRDECRRDEKGRPCCVEASREGCYCEQCSHNDRCDRCNAAVCAHERAGGNDFYMICGGGAFVCEDCDGCVKRCKNCGACNCADGGGYGGCDC